MPSREFTVTLDESGSRPAVAEVTLLQKKWLYRLILSYLPILFCVVFVLILVFFFTISETTKSQSVRANRVYADQVMQIVDSTLQNIDTMASKNLLLSEEIQRYFDNAADQGSYEYYRITEILLDFMAPLPMIDSVYLYREADGKVIMQQYSSDIEEFGDRTFIRQASAATGPYLWSGIRTISLFGESRQVVSLVKRVPYYSGEDGLIVINIRGSSLQSLVRDMQLGGGSAVCLTDAADTLLAGSGETCMPGAAAWSEEGANRLDSAYSGLRLRIGAPQGSWFALVSGFSYFWVVLGIVAVTVGIAATTYISHRHYRPIEQVMNRILAFRQGRNVSLSRGPLKDEFAFIDQALETMIEERNSFDKQQMEGLVYRRAMMFMELLDGTRVLNPDQLDLEMGKAGLPYRFAVVTVAVAEIDRYDGFASRYSSRDQSLFKFTLRSALQEIADGERIPLWTEWVSPARLGLLFALEDERDEARLAGMAERWRGWVEQYLAFTVTIGFAPATTDSRDLRQAYLGAKAALERKWPEGPNRVYAYVPSGPMDAAQPMDQWLKRMREAAQLFRLGNPDWHPLLDRCFDALSSGAYSPEDAGHLIRMFQSIVLREMEELPAELRPIWETEGRRLIAELPEAYEWSQEAKAAVVSALAEAERKLRQHRMEREHYTLAARLRDYIAERHADPDLSLAQLGDAFSLNVKTLSRVFKDEIGEKFVDYVTRLRIEHAKELLADTQAPVQDIAAEVGYLHAMSFIRAFKKVTGMTPGDYRRDRQA